MTLAADSWTTREQIAPVVVPADLGIGVLFDRVQDAVVVADLASCTIALWNAAAERLFGYTAAEAVGQPVEMLMPAGMPALHRASVRRYAHTGRGLIMNAPAPVEVPAVTKDGTDVRIQLSLSELPGRFGRRYALALMRDATYRKEFELMRLEIERLRKTTDALYCALAAATQVC